MTLLFHAELPEDTATRKPNSAGTLYLDKVHSMLVAIHGPQRALIVANSDQTTVAPASATRPRNVTEFLRHHAVPASHTDGFDSLLSTSRATRCRPYAPGSVTPTTGHQNGPR